LRLTCMLNTFSPGDGRSQTVLFSMVGKDIAVMFCCWLLPV
jgi:hypothetical protein